jgi:hypothetical protein
VISIGDIGRRSNRIAEAERIVRGLDPRTERRSVFAG